MKITFEVIEALPEGARIVVEKGCERTPVTFVSAEKYPTGKSVLAQLDDSRFHR